MKLLDLKTHLGIQKLTTNLLVTEKSGYLRLEFSDATRVVMNIFSNDKNYDIYNQLEKEKLLLVDVEMEYTGKNTSGYDTYNVVSLETKDRPSLIDVVKIDYLKDELRQIISNIKNPVFHNLLFAFCKNKEFLDKFFIAPCTEKSAYSFKGGILAHTVRLCKLIDSISNTYESWDANKGGFNSTLDTELMKTIAIFHDAGRAYMYEIDDETIEKTFQGELLSSTEISVNILNELIQQHNIDISSEQKVLLQHCISASGNNSQCLPRTKEAIVFNFIEKIDTTMGNFEYMDKVSIGDDFQRLLDKNYCLIEFNDL